jgi:enoyl-CoA hydratase
MTDIIIRTEGRAGRITLNRPKALNALTWDMCLAIEAALDKWSTDNDIALVLMDATGDRAFCAGGDIADMYRSGQENDLDYGRRFWADEYRLNYKISTYAKPVVSFLHGFTMGGGVGVGCHASRRIVCETSQIAMPECGIGLVPDVGGSLLLARAPGRCGAYLGLSGDRMDASDAIYAGFADGMVSQDRWDTLKAEMIRSGDISAIDAVFQPTETCRLETWQADIDRTFDANTLPDLQERLAKGTPFHDHASKLLKRNSPLAMAAALRIIDTVRQRPDDMAYALTQEYQFTYRAVAQSDFIEGIRAAIIDKDRNPRWQHACWDAVTEADLSRMTAPLGDAALQLGEQA